MASLGTLYTTPQSWSYSGKSGTARIVVELTYSGDSSNNRDLVYWNAYLSFTGASYQYGKNIAVYVGGSCVVSTGSTAKQYSNGQSLGSGSLWVSHDANGAGSCSVSASGSFVVYSGSTSGSASYSLPTYNGASTFGLNSTSVTLGNSLTATVSKVRSGNTHRFFADTKNPSGSDIQPYITSGTSSTSVSVPFSEAIFAYLIPTNAKSAATKLYMNSWNSSGSYLGYVSTSVTITMPASIGAPTGCGIKLKSSSYKALVFTITPPSTKYGAKISDYVITATRGTVSRSGNTITVDLGTNTDETPIKVTVKAVDSRGFNSNTASLTVTPPIAVSVRCGDTRCHKIYYGDKQIKSIYYGDKRIV